MRTFAIVLLSACASTTAPTIKGGPRGPHADEHLTLARDQDALAREDGHWPDTMTSPAGPAYIPWTRTWDSAADHERLAAVHRSKASELHAAYEQACGDRPPEQVAVSPLQRWGVSGWNTQAGVILYLRPSAGTPERLLADLKCHRAWMMLSDAGMDDCPLDLPAITLDVRGDDESITVLIGVRDPTLVDELHRRAAHDLEAGARLRSNAAD
jgi:hypothetical protein